LQRAAEKARRTPGNEAALLELEIQRHSLQQQIAAAEAQPAFAAEDVAIRQHDLDASPESELDENGEPIEGLTEADREEWKRMMASSSRA
jgi:hypothetical protein